MNICEIKALPVEERESEYFGIELNDVDVEPAEGVAVFGFLADFDEDGLLDNIIDTMIGYRLSGKEVFLEIPADKQDINRAEYLMSLAENLGFSISLLPPVKGSEKQAYQSYQDVIWSYGEEYFKRKSFKGEVLPFTSYLQYLFMEVISDPTGFTPTSPYVISAFVDQMNECDVDEMKAHIKAKTYELFDGEENFSDFVKALIGGVIAITEEFVRDVVELTSKSEAEGKCVASGSKEDC